mmetsp:Transcript_14130/g.40178  ORF Transcript_14130/g.40178 Transcript_14130/m.40178 type:complete len:413 (+) Transcript_14130:50-1288(+)
MSPWAILALYVGALCPRTVALQFDNNRKGAELQSGLVNTSDHNSGIKSTPWVPYLDVGSGKLLGEGGFGQAFSYKLKDPCEGSVVVKQIKPNSTVTNADMQREITTLYAFQEHPHILKLYDHFPRSQKDWFGTETGQAPLQLLTEAALGGELKHAFDVQSSSSRSSSMESFLLYWNPDAIRHHRLQKKTKVVLMMAKELLAGLKHMHDNGYLHRDIKPENLWAADAGRKCVKDMSCRYLIGDLGLAIKESEFTKDVSCAGTLEYMPFGVDNTTKKLTAQCRQGSAGDVFSLGFSLAEVMALPETNYHRPLTAGRSDIFDEINKAAKTAKATAARTAARTATPRLVQLLLKMVDVHPETMKEVDPNERPTADVALTEVRSIINDVMPDFPAALAQDEDSNEPPCLTELLKNLP